MGKDWIIDVLADLRTFAQKNDLPILAVQLEETALCSATTTLAGSDNQLVRWI